MKTDTFELEGYINDKVDLVISEILQATRTNLQANMFFAKFARAAQNARSLREKSAEEEEHIPPMLIADITTQYSKKQKVKTGENELVTEQEWLKLFAQAEELGVVFILLRGGEPLLCPNVLKGAAKLPKILFPILTNGMLIDDYYVKLFDKNRNLFPVFQLNGDDIFKEIFQGAKIYSDYDPVVEKMEALLEHRIVFGAVVTANSDNLDHILHKEYLNKLYDRGCRAVIYTAGTIGNGAQEVLDEEGRKFLRNQLKKLRDQYMGMVFLQIPEDGKAPDGCLAAGRGFFHITAGGAAQPCPATQFHDRNIRVYSLRDAIQSPFFCHLKESNLLVEEEKGVCALEGKEELLKLILR